MMMRKIYLICAVLLTALSAVAQPRFSKPHGLIEEKSITVELTTDDPDAVICYTTNGTTPTAQSRRYTGPLTFTQTTLLRAAEVKGDTLSSPVATASYLFVSSVLSQSNSPVGYPDTWGQYTERWGTATADYEMDPEMTGDATLRPKIIEGLKDLPILSLVSDKDNFFSHENDSVRGGIYIFTGPPVGDGTGHGWTRPASVELIGGPQGHDLTVGCGVRLHGGHGRLAEKNPKHSFRLVFKEKYGAKTLQYPLFGDDEPSKFDQLVLRCHFGNSWQHWAWSNNSKAQYTRDVWARRMQRKMGWTSVNALYVHLFLNGMYWGLYNIAERVDDQYGKDHLGGKKSDIDVVKIEEDGGNHIEASEGDLEAWGELVQTATRAADDTYYYRLQGCDADGERNPELEPLLDIDAFIDYMLINQYGGNTDWDHHNWYALRSSGANSKGFRFLCWDSEIIEENVQENTLNKNNGNSYPTGIFHNLLNNERFARQYLRRAKELLAPEGLLGEESVVELWDSLHSVIASALYAEAARWGDYRRDVHQYTSKGQLYTVDNQYAAERKRLLTQYFPYRSDIVLGHITSYLNIDDFEAPEGWEKLTAKLFCEWDGNAADSQPTGRNVNVDWNMGVNAGGGTAVAGFGNVTWNQYADLTNYESLVLRGSGYGLRVLANRLVDHGPYKQIIVNIDEDSPYWNNDYQSIIMPLEDLANINTNEGKERVDDFVHLHVLKVNWNDNVRVTSAWLIPKPKASITGDVNGDGTVDVADISAIISVMAGASVPDASASGTADVNGDGAVDVADVSAVITIMASE